MTRFQARLTRILTLVGVAGPIYYVGFVTLIGLLWAGYDPISQTQSELGAVDAPLGLLMNVGGFMALGVVILAFAAGFHLVLRPSNAKLLATVLLAIAGVGMVTVGFFSCDAGCVDVTRTSELHSTFSMPGAIGLPAAAMVSSWVFRSDGRFGPGWQVASFLLGLATLASGPIIAADLLPDQVGLLQRAAMWTPILWMSAVSVRLSALTQPAHGARPFMARLRDASLVALLRSRVGRSIRGMTVVTFKGRRSGRTLRTPVEYVYETGRLFVLVGHPEAKQWWRNVMANPDVLVEVDGNTVPGLATVHTGTGETAEHDLGVYFDHRPRVARSFGVERGSDRCRDRLTAAAARTVSVRIDLLPAPTA